MNKPWGNLFAEGLKSVANAKSEAISKKVGSTDVVEEIADQLAVEPDTIWYWRRGHVPDLRRVAWLAEYTITHGRVGPRWLQDFLKQAEYPTPNLFVEKLFPGATRNFGLPPVETYHNLPSRPGDFVGRGREIQEILQLLKARWPIVSIEGIGGAGKTTLAKEVAHTCIGQPRGPTAPEAPVFDAVIWIQSDPERGLAIDEMLNTIARTLRQHYIADLPLDRRKEEEVNERLRGHRVLLAVDNFETVTHPSVVEFIQWVPEPSKVLLTTRERPTGLQSVWHYHLKGLSDKDAFDLIRRQAERLGLDGVIQASDDALQPLVQVTEGNPKALEVALGYAQDTGVGLDALVRHLADAAEDVEELMEYLFARAWGYASEATRRLWMAVSLFPAPVAKDPLAAVADVSGQTLREGLEQLIRRSLLDFNRDELEDARRRYTMHPLSRAFGARKLRDDHTFEAQARERWVEWYLGFVQKHGGEDRDNWADYQMLDDERENILAVAQWCHESRLFQPLWELVKHFKQYLHVCGYWNERLILLERALQLAKSENAKRGVALCLNGIAWTLHLTYRLDETTKTALQEALALARELDDATLMTQIFSTLAYVAEYLENHVEAERWSEKEEAQIARIESKEVKERYLIENRYRRGLIAYGQKDRALARQHFEEVLTRSERFCWDRAIAYAANWLGDIALDEGQSEAARRWYDRSWDAIRPWNDLRRMAYLQFSEARLAAVTGRQEEARRLAESALNQFLSLDMRRETQKTQVFITNLEKEWGPVSGPGL